MRQLKKVNVSNNSIEMYSMCPNWVQCRPEINGRSESSCQTNPNWAGTSTTTTTTTAVPVSGRKHK